MVTFRSHASNEFWDLYNRLARNVQVASDKQFALFRRDPTHPCFAGVGDHRREERRDFVGGALSGFAKWLSDQRTRTARAHARARRRRAGGRIPGCARCPGRSRYKLEADPLIETAAAVSSLSVSRHDPGPEPGRGPWPGGVEGQAGTGSRPGGWPAG